MELDKDLLDAFATTLKHCRKKTGLNQEELARMVGINRTYVAKLELSMNQPSLTIIDQIAKTLGYKTSEFFKLIESNYENSSSS